MRRISDWELSIGFYPGILFGGRSYVEKERVDHVLYLPFVDLCLSLYYEHE
jgi:hypothetical protein